MGMLECFDDALLRIHQGRVDAESARAVAQDGVAAEIEDTMLRALCGGEDVLVPVAVVNDEPFEDEVDEIDAWTAMSPHAGDNEAEFLLRALLRTNCPEARALVRYCASEHARLNADQINDIRDRVAMEH
jgi:hypothetical protein